MKNFYNKFKKTLLVIIGTALFTGIAYAALAGSPLDYAQNTYKANMQLLDAAQQEAVRAQQNEALAFEAACSSRKSVAAMKLTMPEFSKDKDHLNKILQDCFYDFKKPAAKAQTVTSTEEVAMGKWKITRYYTPVKGQKRYFNGSYGSDFYINCQGDCRKTANGYYLEEKDEYKVVACPPNIKLGTVLRIEDIGIVTCQDRGGAIKGKRLDVWAGIGERGLDNIYGRPETSGSKKVYKLITS